MYQRGQQPPPDLTVDEWADDFRFINAAKNEKWFTDRMEVARGPMRAVTEPAVRTISVMCSTQLMKTEIILNVAGYFIDNDPCPILILQPKDDMARKFSNVRLKEMIRATPRLNKIFDSELTRDSSNTAQHKEFPGGHIDIVSANVPANLAMFSIRVVLCDEIDKYDDSSGEEGDPISLAEERMSKYASNSLSIAVCSPTVTGDSRIEDRFNSSDKRLPFVACPHCQHKQVLYWKNVKWEKGEKGECLYKTAQYVCTGCGTFWSEYDRHVSLEKIYWLQTADFQCTECQTPNKPSTWNPNDLQKWDELGHAICDECGEGKCDNSHAGFWANKLYSTFRPISDMARVWSEVKGSVERLKSFINTQLAETFDDPGDHISTIDWLMKRREMYNAEVPDGVGIITAGVDTQNNRLEVELVGWGKDEESWSLDYHVIPGDPGQPETWNLLTEYLNKKRFFNDGSFTYVAAAAIDMGGGHTQSVANYCNKNINRRFWPIRGVAAAGKPYPVWPKEPSRGGKVNVPFYNIGVDAGKNTVFNRLFIEHPGTPGYCHYPHDRTEDWFKQLTAEKRVKEWKGTRKVLVWKNPRKARNEAFDNRVYAFAALCGLQQMGWDLNSAVENKSLVLLSDKKKEELQRQQSPLKKEPTKVRSKKRVAKSNFMSR